MGALRFKDDAEFNNFMANRQKAPEVAVTTEREKPKRVNREEAAQIEIFQVLTLNEKKYPFLKWIHASMNRATSSSKAQAGKRRACGQKSGVADICIPYARRGYHGAWIEVKILPNKASVSQSDFLLAMTREGYYARLSFSSAEVFQHIEYYFDIKLAR